tara:strand:- start:307 stop:495 length:189 start_codon:yes stop_codon:yes gene_type:complete
MRQSLGQQIKEERKLQGITQIELANKSGLNQQDISNLENGKIPNPEKLEKIGKVLGKYFKLV